MRIVVNHVTRMKDARICVAGLDAATFRHVRPVTSSKSAYMTRALLREHGGPFGTGALVDLGTVAACPNAPETEDHRFAAARAKRVRDLAHDVYFELLHRVSDEDFPTAFGPELVEVRPRKFAVPAGRGKRSLAVVPVVNPKLRVEFKKLYLTVGAPSTPAKLRVTDVRFYDADHALKRKVIYDVNRRLASGVTAYAMLGLARAIPDDDAGDVHWLMANGLCLADRAVGDVP
ncbi:MAG: dual OB domain-containing protein [Solirubrobacteraceae bacterium]